VNSACDPCLRRGALIGLLSPRIAELVGQRRREAASLLSLPDDQLVAAVGGPTPATERLRATFDANLASEDLRSAQVEAVCRHSSRYPSQLGALHDEPNPLFVKGSAERLARLAQEPCVAIVGARECSEYARGVAQSLGRSLAAAGVTVVSGLARGIDGAAHQGAMAADGAAIAVLAGGPDWIYPKRHAALYRQILQTGTVVSEMPPGTRPRAWGFPARNRIMAGLARVVVVVEAAESSGSLITADFASQVSAEVAAVPGRVTARIAAGSNALLHDGAAVIRDAEDVLDLVYGVGCRPKQAKTERALEPALRHVLDAVEVGDSLPAAARRASLTAGELRGALGRLEALGLVYRDGFGGYERSATG
jgi:DNA processing protein